MKTYLPCIAFVMLTLSTVADETTEQALNDARSAIQSKDYPIAIEKLMEVNNKSSDKEILVKTKNAIGWAYYLNGHNDLAQEFLMEAYELSSSMGAPSKTALNNLGLLEFSRENYTEAKKYFSNPAVINTKTAQEYLQIIRQQEVQIESGKHISSGQVLEASNQLEAAIAEYDKALEISPQKPEAFKGKGSALLKAQKYDESLKSLKAASTLDPGNEAIQIKIIRSYCGKGDKENAIKIARELYKSGASIPDFSLLENECDQLTINELTTIRDTTHGPDNTTEADN